MTNIANHLLLPSYTLVIREVVRFFRQRSRILTAVLSPLLMWLVIGSGIGRLYTSPLAPGGKGYLEYFYPGTILMAVLFLSIFSTITLIEDRREGFLQGVLVAPVSRLSIVLGRILSGVVLASIQGCLFLFLSPAAGIPFSLESLVLGVLSLAFVSFALTSLGFLLAWRLDSIQGFHGVMNLFLLPMWFLSGALFPLPQNGAWIAYVMKLNPLTYGLALFRRALYVNHDFSTELLPSAATSILILGILSVLLIFLCVREVNRPKV